MTRWIDADELLSYLSNIKGERFHGNRKIRFGNVYGVIDCMLNQPVSEYDKYRWHDLRKNPDDLPPDDEDVYVKAKIYCKWDKQYRIFVIQMSYNRKIMYGKPIGWGHSYPYMFEFETDEVIAWRYIEPSEVEE